MSTLEKLFEEVDDLEKQVKKKWPKQRGRVILANIKTEMDYEFDPPETDADHIKWAIEYKAKLKAQVAE